MWDSSKRRETAASGEQYSCDAFDTVDDVESRG
jgi:hypothetical protein